MSSRQRMTVQATVGALMVVACVFPGAADAQEVGPPRGSLVIVGGAMRDPAIIERFIQLAGGPDAPIVVIPTAGGGDTYDQYYPGLRSFRDAGATDLTVLHTTDRQRANSEAFVAPLRRARGVWFTGGRQWRLADAYLDTRVHDELRGVLDRGGVIGGSSAGATILGSYLARGDTAINTIMMGDHEVGFGFLHDVAIDQHLLRRNRQFDLLEVIEAHPELLGIGLDEDTAIVVQGDEFEVVGRSYVVIYDHERMLDSGGRFYFLGAGDRYDLKARTAFRMQRARRPLERVVERPWQ
ncbi:MAG: cyanophycinase [Acidobacteria bacterium]|nr:MAG: cyanophycinase [Acidobacteriota bacterium]